MCPSPMNPTVFVMVVLSLPFWCAGTPPATLSHDGWLPRARLRIPPAAGHHIRSGVWSYRPFLVLHAPAAQGTPGAALALAGAILLDLCWRADAPARSTRPEWGYARSGRKRVPRLCRPGAERSVPGPTT